MKPGIVPLGFRFFLILLVVIACLLLQTAVFGRFLFWIKVQLFLPLLLFFGMRSSFLKTLSIAFILGYLAELHSGSPSGVIIVSYMLLVTLFNWGRQVVLGEVLSAPLIAGAIAGVLYQLIVPLVSYLAKIPIATSFFSVILSSVLTSLFSPLLFAIMQRIEAIGESVTHVTSDRA